MPLYLELWHGRDYPDEQLDDWGKQGPVLGPFDYVHIVYLTHIQARYSNSDKVLDMDEIRIVNDLILYAGVYYGDCAIHSEETVKSSEVLQRLLVEVQR